MSTENSFKLKSVKFADGQVTVLFELHILQSQTLDVRVVLQDVCVETSLLQTTQKAKEVLHSALSDLKSQVEEQGAPSLLRR